MLVTNGAFIESRPTGEDYLWRVCYESHIEEVTLKGRPYKDLGSPTPIASFWGVVLPRIYARNTVLEKCMKTQAVETPYIIPGYIALLSRYLYYISAEKFPNIYA